MAKLPNIFLIGPMGAGKSTIGRHLAKQLQMSFFDTDEVIEQRTGATVAWIFDIEGEAGFRKREHQVINELTQKQNIVLATGGGVITTPENRTLLAARGTVVYLKTSLKQQFERTKRDKKRPLLRTDDLPGRLESLREDREPHYEDLADFTFDTDNRTVKTVANEIVEKLKSM